MDAKDLRTGAALGERSNDGNTKYAQSGGALPCHRNKVYQDIGSSPLGKVDAPAARPCAVIGPDRVVPPSASSDVYLKKGPSEPWLAPDNSYRRPPDYPHKLLDYQHPSRNISPRQTFQENMQRIMVPPSYNAAKLKEDHSYPGETNISQMRNNKLNVNTDSNSKYCDVPYTVSPLTNDQKNVRNTDISVTNMTSVLARSAPHGWNPMSSNVRPTKPYLQDLCQYPEYSSCSGPRPMVVSRPHRTVHEEPGPLYPEAYYHDGNIRFKPYPSPPVKDRYPQTRYEYIGNYSNPFHPPPPFPTHKYEVQKPLPSHPYPSYPQVPLKYLDSRMTEPIINGYQRSINQQAAYNNIPFRNQVIHHAYGPIPGNCIPTNKYYPYPPDPAKSMTLNKLPYDANTKLYPDFESNRNKNYPLPDGFYINDARAHPTKGSIAPPNYPTNIHAMPTHPYYRKDPLKGYEYSPHFRNMDPTLNLNGSTRFPSQFSPSAIAISPADSHTSNDTNQTQGTSQEDCGYVSQSSTTSIRSMDSGINRMPPDLYRRYDQRYGQIVKNSALSRLDQNSRVNAGSKEKKEIDVRQFLQMWNEGEDENGENNNKETNMKSVPNDSSSCINPMNYEPTNQEQLYVLGLVNVPSEELGKYEHIQKVSKLPENIKGYNSIELLHQFEEVIESSNLNHYTSKSPPSKEFHSSINGSVPLHGISIPSRPLSPLDVEAKISQSVIHKEVGCNFEIKPCSPKMLNVEIATPVQNVIGERIIEKVTNSLIIHSPINTIAHNEGRDDYNIIKSQDLIAHEVSKVTSCKMVNKPFGNKDSVDPIKTNYSIQDLESNSGVCLASLPRLDNDIELNFPEVNQQFINANKVDSVITSTPMKDLPPLDVDHSESVNLEKQTNTLNSNLETNVDTDFSKLSKYRKLKRKGSEPNTPDSNVQALRTDSVIIKNPDNCKSHENVEKALSPKNNIITNQDDPINLSVSTEESVQNSTNELIEDKPNDFAIDFSINTQDPYNNVKNINLSTEIDKNKNLDSDCDNSVKEEQHKDLSVIHENTKFKSVCNNNDITTSTVMDYDSAQTVYKETCYIPKRNDNNIESSEIQFSRVSESKDKLNSEFVVSKSLENKQNLSKDSTYCLEKSPEREDALNERMRELFGEEFSNVESESTVQDLEAIHDTEAILDDDFVNSEKDYVLTEESSLLNDERITENHIIQSYHKQKIKEIKTEFTGEKELLTLSDANRCLSANNDVQAQIVEADRILKNDEPLCAKYGFGNLNADSVVTLRNTNISTILPKNSQNSDLFHLKKELMSPQIQNLILYYEGPCTTKSDDQALISVNSTIIKLENDKDLIENVEKMVVEYKINKKIENDISFKFKDHEISDPVVHGSNTGLDKENDVETNRMVIDPVQNEKANINSKIASQNEVLKSNDNEHKSQDGNNCINVLEPSIGDSTCEVIEIPKNKLTSKFDRCINVSYTGDGVKCNAKLESDAYIEVSRTTIDNKNLEEKSSTELLELANHNNNENQENRTYPIVSETEITDEINEEQVVSKVLKATDDCKLEDTAESDTHSKTSDKVIYYDENEKIKILDNNDSAKLNNDDESNAMLEANSCQQITEKCKKFNSEVKYLNTTPFFNNDSKNSQKCKIAHENQNTSSKKYSENIIVTACEDAPEERFSCVNTISKDELTFNNENNVPSKKILEDAKNTKSEIDTIIDKNSDTFTEISENSMSFEASIDSNHILSENITAKSCGFELALDETYVGDAYGDSSKSLEGKLSDNYTTPENPEVTNIEQEICETSITENETPLKETTWSETTVEKSDNENGSGITALELHSDVEIRSKSIFDMAQNAIDFKDKNKDLVPEKPDSLIEFNACIDKKVHKDVPSSVTNDWEKTSDKDFSEPNIQDKIVSKRKSEESSINSLVIESLVNEHNILGHIKEVNTRDVTGMLSLLQDFNTNINVTFTEHSEEVLLDDLDVIMESEPDHAKDRHEITECTEIDEKSTPEQCKNVQSSNRYLKKRRKSLKRSLSDSALNEIRDSSNEVPENNSMLWPSKRMKETEINNDNSTPHFIAENICDVIQNNRRNSVSSIQNEESVSFCILIDNDCIISEECDDSEKICLTEYPMQEESINDESSSENTSFQEDYNCEYSTLHDMNCAENDKPIEEPWVEDVACVETVVSDDIAEDIVISASSSPKDDDDEEETEIYNINEHTEKLKFIYGDKMYKDDSHFVDTLYRTPQMNVNRTLHRRESQITDECNQYGNIVLNSDDESRYYDKESLEKLLSEPNIQEDATTDSGALSCRTPLPSPVISEMSPDDDENADSDSRNRYRSDTPLFDNKNYDIDSENQTEKCDENNEFSSILNDETKMDTIDSCESSIDDVFIHKKSEENPKFTISSSPEVSSTTSEEKSSGILLKITNYGGSMVAEVNDINPINRISCKYTEKKDYLSSTGKLPNRTLITKAAQKYIPPLKETIRDLKVKLPLPPHNLMKLRQLKLAKEAIKPNIDKPANTLKKEFPKKLKPKFEDVLKSIDELQYQQHKEKKKVKKIIPKVVIKKNENGSHYASTSSRDKFNPDLTGRKWQPWVFLEKDHFIDKMAVKKKTRAIYNHRKKSYVLAEKFQKYKSICNTKFVITQPKTNDLSSGQLKYTIRLKHSY